MVEIQVGPVRDLQRLVNDSRLSLKDRSLAVRRFCNEYKPSAFANARDADDTSAWTLVDTEHLLTISSDMLKLENYLVERVVAAS